MSLGRVIAIVALFTAPVTGQWLNEPTRGIPRTADGKPNLTAPAPRASDGHIDLTGLWQPAPDPKGRPGGVEGAVGPRYLIDVTIDYPPSAVPFQPWARELYKARNDNMRRDNPLIRCLPAGVPRLNAYTHPYKIVQTRDLIVVLYESMTTFRQIFVDGRQLPKDPEPTWMGYSVGRWDGEVLVVESTGFNDQTWLDGAGHPHSDAMHLTERFVRRDFGHMDIEVTIDDPKAYTTPLRYTQPQILQADTELIEYVCGENSRAISDRLQ